MWKSILKIFLQSNCCLCQRSSADTVCSSCEKLLIADGFANPAQFWQQPLPLFAWASYEGQVKKAIASLKYNGHQELGEIFGVHLAKAWLNASSIAPKTKILIVPIPLHRKKLKTRGFNQAEVIARSFCLHTGYPLLSEGLIRVRDTQAMYGLKINQRQENIQDAFALGNGWQKYRDSSVLLIDDIYTTGNTVREAAKVIQAKGIKVLGILAVAKTTGYVTKK